MWLPVKAMFTTSTVVFISALGTPANARELAISDTSGRQETHMLSDTIANRALKAPLRDHPTLDDTMLGKAMHLHATPIFAKCNPGSSYRGPVSLPMCPMRIRSRPMQFRSSKIFAEAPESQQPKSAPIAKPPVERKPGKRSAALPAPDDLKDEELLTIVTNKMSDEDVNKLIWKYLGYRYDEASGTWDASKVFPEWAAEYPEPPDLMGLTRNFSEREVDEPVLLASKKLHKLAAWEHKQNMKYYLAPLGWKGYKIEDITGSLGPNRRRRGVITEWLYFYREALHGVPFEEMCRRQEQAKAQGAQRDAAAKEAKKAEVQAQKEAIQANQPSSPPGAIPR
eukprot:gnl/TRDRNA2_/TRDRNA2_192224_c0_seq1.p1 gnl/TRDRNA2_/TRDRNA2_192224_c0~~gnl/TRDRNA2_/TRDRNA2_192224_c0_seq1.p1  ORF type:complete len:339 (-),score=62.03 gnl/TRDRNA2_/TRDRNA2_192224_c0_seq1:88-1104(-)